MISRRASITLIFLSSLVALWGTLSVFVSDHSLALIDGPWITLLVDDQPYPLVFGVIPLWLVAAVFALLLIFMIAEFFGGKEALAASLATALVILLTGAGLKALPFLPGNEGEIFQPPLPSLLSHASQIFIGFTSMILIYELLRRFTHNGFMIVRLFLASFLGVIVPVVIEIFFYQPSFGKMISLLMTRYVQWNLLFFMLIPLYYLLYAPLRLMVGNEQREEMKTRFQKKKIFQHTEKNFFEKRDELQEQRILPEKKRTAVGEGGG